MLMPLCLVTVFFLSFLFLKTIFYFLKQKTCLVTVFRQKLKTIFNFYIVKETENRCWAIFIFQFSQTLENTEKTRWNSAELMNQRKRSTHNTNKNIFPAHPFFFTKGFSAVSDSTLYIFFLCASTASILPREEKTLIERTKVWVFSFFLCWCWVCALNRVNTMDFCSIWFSSRTGFQRFYSMEQNFLSLCSTFSYPLYHVRLWVFSVLCCALLIFCACDLLQNEEKKKKS